MRTTLVLLFVATQGFIALATKPNIVYIMADDLGNNDIGYINNQVISPTIDELANKGTILTQAYMQSMCTPSRSALMTSIYPHKSKMQHGVISDTEPKCVPLDLKFLPERLKESGYATHMLGKWHLGFCREECLPTHRGFDTFYGMWTGMGTFWTHIADHGYDWQDNDDTDLSANGTYASDLIAARAVELIEDMGDDPFFMFLSYPNPHTPLEAPQQYIDMYGDIEPAERKTYLASVTAMDSSLYQVIEALKAAGKYDNTIFLFSSDNGADSHGASHNGELRGFKGSQFEGGTRVPMFFSGPGIQSGEQNDGVFHVTDIGPTLFSLIDEPLDAADLDGVDNSAMLTEGAVSDRDEMVYMMDLENMPYFGQAAIRIGDMKLIWGNNGWADGRDFSPLILNQNPEHIALLGGKAAPSGGRHRRGLMTFTYFDIMVMRKTLQVQCFDVNTLDVNTGDKYLFNLADDPNEYTNLAEDPAYADVVLLMQQRIIDLQAETYAKPEAERSVKRHSAKPENSGGCWATGWCTDMAMDMGA